MLLCESVWEQELQGSIVLIGASVSQSGFLEYPFPRDAQELRHFLRFLKRCILSCTESVKEKPAREIFTKIAEKNEQRGIVLFNETIPDSILIQCFLEYQVLRVSLVHPTEWQISKNAQIPSHLLAGPVSTTYGAQLILNQPDQINLAFQTAFHLW